MDVVFSVYFAYISTPFVVVFAEHSFIHVPFAIVQEVGSSTVEHSLGSVFLVISATFVKAVAASLLIETVCMVKHSWQPKSKEMALCPVVELSSHSPYAVFPQVSLETLLSCHEVT